MLQIAIPFLATSESQLDEIKNINCDAVEAVIFNREDLENDRWYIVWKNISKACEIYGSKNVIFHFPVNNSDYVADLFVRDRVKEAYHRAFDLDLSGMVIHSNRIRPIYKWININLIDERRKVVDTLVDIKSSLSISNSSEKIWIGLENMPVMDNHGIEIDPLFSFPNDFSILEDTNIGITWDICHYTNTLANIHEVLEGKQRKEHYPNIQKTHLNDFHILKSKIVHWHFSAFLGIADPNTGSKCKEGVLPYESTLGEVIYDEALKTVNQISMSGRKITLEIQEKDYVERHNVKKMINWILERLN
ncbi:TIM barrel protein [Microcoleus sp.]|uniref:TIM barrel protein n=1 Tax=Microcoleus sp. TaxID=44472 RepID=UPI003525DE88